MMSEEQIEEKQQEIRDGKLKLKKQTTLPVVIQIEEVKVEHRKVQIKRTNTMRPLQSKQDVIRRNSPPTSTR